MKEEDILKMRTEKDISAAHFVQTDSKSKYRRLHGHNWHIEVTIDGLVADDGMIMDKSKVDDSIEQLDHKTIIPEMLIDSEENESITVRHNSKEYKFPKEDVIIVSDILVVTSENLAKMLAKDLYHKQENIFAVTVDVGESKKISCGYFYCGDE